MALPIDRRRLVADASALVACPSLTGAERPALDLLAAQATALGLDARIVQEDLTAVVADAGFPGMEVAREELTTLEVTLRGRDPNAPRIAICGHLDTVAPGTRPWRRDPFAGAIDGDRLHGLGAVDLKGATTAALHGLAALVDDPPPGDVVLLGVAGEEDGGVGAYAALRRDDRYAACLIVEPTGFDVVCAHAGALTFSGVVPGRTAHAAVRRAGCSAIDRYVRLHAALAAHEAARNAPPIAAEFAHLDLPYPLLVGTIAGGHWSSQVPDRLEFSGRLGVPPGVPIDRARHEFEAVVAAALDDGEAPATIAWDGGQFAAAHTPADHWLPQHLARIVAARTGRTPAILGVPYGADMRHFTSRGIPTVMVGTSGIERAHAPDEWVSIAELDALASVVADVAVAGTFGP